jgi:ribosomal protein L17
MVKHKPRKLKRLYDQRAAMMESLVREYFTHNRSSPRCDPST